MLNEMKSRISGKKTIILFLVMTAFLFAQSWNNIVTTTINEPNCDRIDLFTNNDGNHIVIQNINSSNSIKYYLLNSSGTVVRSSTIETSSGAQFPNISGDNDKVYIVYKLGSNLKAVYTTNAGQSWNNNIPPQSIGNNTCNGVDIVYDYRGIHVVYAMQDNGSDYETYYRLIVNETWSSREDVTDYDREVGGLPRIALSTNKVHVVYNTGEGVWESNNAGSIISRDKDLVNNNWEDPLLAFEPPSNQGAYNQQVIIDNNNIEWCFTLLVFPSPQTENIWIGLFRPINGSWDEFDQLPPQGSACVHQLTFSHSKNNEGKIFTFYSVNSSTTELYKTIILNGSIISSTSTSEIHPLPLQLKSSSVSNDVFLIWRNSGSNYLSYQQYDEVPFAPQNLAVTVSSSNHPLLSWTKNNEPDVVSYTIEKAFCGYQQACTQLDWQVIGNTNQSYYVDELETYCTTPPPEACEGYSVWYRVKAVDSHPYESSPSNEVETTVNLPQHKIAVESPTLEVPKVYSLDQNYPNPFNPVTKISFGLPKEGLVTIKVFDVLGNEVAVLVDEIKPEGKHEVEFNANNLPSGIYIYKMQSGKFIAVNKMILLR